MARKTRSLDERFWEKVNKAGPDECWEWNASRDSCGYGRIGKNGINTAAHRISYELHFGPIPDGMCVCHNCDNPPCVNPSHLWCGTKKDNIRDMVAKGRHKPTRGSAHHATTLTENKIKAIRYLYKKGRFSQENLAEMFYTTRPTIGRIITKETWGHVK